MHRLTISLVMLATSAFAADDLASLAGFESAFRRALEARDVDQLDRLTCWDGVSAQDRTRWHDIYFTTCFYEIDRFKVVPATEAVDTLRSFGHLSLTPIYVFDVHYHLRPLPNTRTRFFSAHYPVGRKNGRFYFVVAPTT